MHILKLYEEQQGTDKCKIPIVWMAEDVGRGWARKSQEAYINMY